MSSIHDICVANFTKSLEESHANILVEKIENEIESGKSFNEILPHHRSSNVKDNFVCCFDGMLNCFFC